MWFNARALANEHAHFEENSHSYTRYPELEHESGEIKISFTGLKSGDEKDSVDFRTVTTHVKRGQTFVVTIETKAKGMFPQLKCGREEYMTCGAVIRIRDPDYLDIALRAVDERFPLPPTTFALLLKMADDWLNDSALLKAAPPSPKIFVRAHGTTTGFVARLPPTYEALLRLADDRLFGGSKRAQRIFTSEGDEVFADAFDLIQANEVLYFAKDGDLAPPPRVAASGAKKAANAVVHSAVKSFVADTSDQPVVQRTSEELVRTWIKIVADKADGAGGARDRKSKWPVMSAALAATAMKVDGAHGDNRAARDADEHCGKKRSRSAQRPGRSAESSITELTVTTSP